MIINNILVNRSRRPCRLCPIRYPCFPAAAGSRAAEWVMRYLDRSLSTAAGYGAQPPVTK